MYRLILLVVIVSVIAEGPPPSNPTSPPSMIYDRPSMEIKEKITSAPPRQRIIPRVFPSIIREYTPPMTSPPRILRPPSPHTLRESNDINPDGSYQWSYETSNGISAEEKGTPLNIPEASIGATGSFKYESLEGPTISLSYVADENGFRPVGDHLPVAPPIPPLIARALEWIASHPEKV